MSPDLSEIWDELFLEVGAFPLLGSDIKPQVFYVAVDFEKAIANGCRVFSELLNVLHVNEPSVPIDGN
jgi:hypothetical protein